MQRNDFQNGIENSNIVDSDSSFHGLTNTKIT